MRKRYLFRSLLITGRFWVCIVVCFCLNGVANGAVVSPKKGTIRTEHCNKSEDCGHGFCNLKLRVCRCFDGWTGLFCDSNSSAVSSGNEANVLSSGAGTKQNLRISQSSRAEKKMSAQGINESPDNKVKASINNAKESEQGRHVCTGHKKRTLKERMCLPGLICTFGTCSSKRHDDFVSFECTCDPGAIGLFCEHKCCLDCGEHGKCALYSNGSEFCDCAFNFYGDKCELSQPGQVGSSSHLQIPVIIIIGLSVISAFLLLSVAFLFLILKDRGCMALAAIPNKCINTQGTAESRGSTTSSVLVHYDHGGVSLPTVTSNNTGMNRQSLPEIIKYPNIPADSNIGRPWTQCTKQENNDNLTVECTTGKNNVYPKESCTNEKELSNQNAHCKTEAGNDVNEVDDNGLGFESTSYNEMII